MFQVIAVGSIVQSYPWLTILPPLLAIVMAIAFHEVNFALLVAVFIGCLLLSDFGFMSSATQMTETLVNSVADADHAAVLLFTGLLGSVISLMNATGGTTAVVEKLASKADTRCKGQVMTWLAGMVIFFDDYANTLLIGGSMRSLFDRLGISRAKLAFIVDATAATVASVALSTWTAYEIQQVAVGIQESQQIAAELSEKAINATASSVFFHTIPFRFYPLITIIAVGVIAFSGKDFGPMWKAERDASLRDRQKFAPSSQGSTSSIWYAVVPILVLVGIVVFGFIKTRPEGEEVDIYRLLLDGSLASMVIAALLPVASGRLTLAACSESIIDGVKSMMPAMVILMLAWSISDVCSADNLNTAGYIVSTVKDGIHLEFLPAAAFLAAGAISVSIGSSYTTMALLLPLFIPLTANLIAQSDVATITSDPIFLATTGAILAGAIFGDHCSPISDTTVLSSAAAGCDHLQHVSTQLPYSLLIATCCVLFGYLPVGFGAPWWIALPIATIICAGAILFLGHTPEDDPSKRPNPKTDAR